MKARRDPGDAIFTLRGEEGRLDTAAAACAARRTRVGSENSRRVGS